jgi:hypothetical protein
MPLTESSLIPDEGFNPMSWGVVFIGLGVLIGFGFLAGGFWFFRKLRNAPLRSISKTAVSIRARGTVNLAEKSSTLTNSANLMGGDQSLDGNPLMLSLFVENQNTAIGRRNIHLVKPGFPFTVGGGKSDFLIFLVPIPTSIAEIRYDGKRCVFIPLKSQYFPDIGSQPIDNCIGRMIRIISDRDYTISIRVERYEDPLVALNRLLLSITTPGLRGF